MKKHFSLITFFCLCIHLYSQPLLLDNTFGGNGIVTTNFTNVKELASCIAIQPDGKIIAAGFGGDTTDFLIARYNIDGSLDPSFGIGGKTITDFNNEYNIATTIAIQPDGKTILSGKTLLDVNESKIAMVRYHINGTIDSSFGSNGKVITSISNNDIITTSILQNDGKIILGGLSTDTTYKAMLIRYNNNGSIDSTFGTNGILFPSANGLNIHSINAIDLDNSGNILAASTAFYNNGNVEFILIKLNSDGTFDNSFGSGGIAINNVISFRHYAGCLKIQNDGKILVGGYAINWNGTAAPSDFYFSIARYSSSGYIDNSFGNSGNTIVPINAEWVTSISIKELNNDKILVTGTTKIGIYDHLTFAVFDTTGIEDSNYGVNGITTTNLINDNCVNAVEIQADGKIIVVGSTDSIVHNFSLARFNNEVNNVVSFEKETFSMYPNPSKNFLTISISNNLTPEYYHIIDITGKIIYSEKIKSTTFSINTEQIPNGMYILRIDNNTRSAKRFCVMK